MESPTSPQPSPFQLFNFSTFDLLISQAAAPSQARQDGADDSRQRLQNEFPSLLPFHNLPFTDFSFTIFPITPSFPITPIPLPLSSPPPEGRLGSLEQPLNVAVAPQRGANPHSRRRRVREGLLLKAPPAWSPDASLQLPHPPEPCGWGRD